MPDMHDIHAAFRTPTGYHGTARQYFTFEDFGYLEYGWPPNFDSNFWLSFTFPV
jgi:hypothetical protein